MSSSNKILLEYRGYGRGDLVSVSTFFYGENMNFAIEHIPNSEYAYALDPNTLRLVLKVQKGEQFKEIGVLWSNKYHFARHRDFSRMRKYGSDGLYDVYLCDITSSDVRFAYVFLLVRQNGEEAYFSEEGLTEDYDFQCGKYPFFQFPYLNEADVMKTIPWTKDAVFYQIFIDRFKRGDFEKDDGYINQAWGAPVNYHSYTGGDLKGITEELPRLSDMGITALYLTPIYKGRGNHKYSIIDYKTIDPMFGKKKDLDELLHRAHLYGIKVVTDTVFNHCGDMHPFFQDVMEKGKESRFYDWFIIHGDYPRKEPCNYETFARCSYMPKWNTSNPEVREYLIGIALTYLSWGFDGLRLDVADEVSHTMWRELRQTVKEHYPEAVIIGEVWHENSMYLRGDEFDGAMNYPLYRVLLQYFALGKLAAMDAAEKINRVIYGNMRQANSMMLNFLDNHDTPRFFTECGEDSAKLQSALVALYFMPGMPCVYYGTELPLAGGADPDCRRTYDWTKKPQYAAFLKQLAEMRQRLPDGDFYATTEDGVLVLVREGQGERAKAYFGKGTKGDAIFAFGDIKVIKEKV